MCSKNTPSAMPHSTQKKDGSSLPDSFTSPTFAIRDASPPLATRVWEHPILQNAIPRVYDSKRRNNYCSEYEEYKRIMINLQKLYPKSPIAELAFEDWVDMRLARVESEKRLLQLKINAAIQKSVLKGDGEYVEIKGCCLVENLPMIDWNTEAFTKIKPHHKGLLPAVSFRSAKPGSDSRIDLEEHRERNNIGFCRIETDRDSYEYVSPSSSMPTLAESFSTFCSPFNSPPMSPVSSANFGATPQFDYQYCCAPSDELRPCYDKCAPCSRVEIGDDVALELGFACADEELESNWATGAKDDVEAGGEYSEMDLTLQALNA